MKPETRKMIADELMQIVRTFVGKSLAPLAAKQASADELLVDAIQRLEALEARLAEVEQKGATALRRVA